MSEMEALVGRRIVAIEVGPDESDLRFRTDVGDFQYSTSGDCCSVSWWADIVGVSALLGEVVTMAEDIEMPNADDDRTRQDIDRQYGIRLTTARGTADLVFRNSSNGYYGGWCSLLPGRDHREPNFRSITEDWRA